MSPTIILSLMAVGVVTLIYIAYRVISDHRREKKRKATPPTEKSKAEDDANETVRIFLEQVNTWLIHGKGSQAQKKAASLLRDDVIAELRKPAAPITKHGLVKLAQLTFQDIQNDR